jgi:hypothetical protein
VVLSEPLRPYLPEPERVYLCQRLDHLNNVVAGLEKQAGVSRAMRAQRLLARADKHRTRAEWIRAYLRAMGV